MDMEKDGKNAMKRLAMNKAKKKMTKTSKVGKKLDEMELMNAPRRSFLESLKPKKKDKK
jgi:hypothetical protein